MGQKDITIIKGSIAYLNDCTEALKNSLLGDKYFPNDESARNAVLAAFAQECGLTEEQALKI